MATKQYFDTGALLKIYHNEAGSQKASTIALRSLSLPLSFILEIEIRTAIRALLGRGSITLQASNQMLDCIECDIAEGRLHRLHLNPSQTEKIAFDLSERFMADILCRSLDILHVANALAAEINTFVTGDKRQAQLAEAAGLKVEFIEIPRNR